MSVFIPDLVYRTLKGFDIRKTRRVVGTRIGTAIPRKLWRRRNTWHRFRKFPGKVRARKFRKVRAGPMKSQGPARGPEAETRQSSTTSPSCHRVIFPPSRPYCNTVWGSEKDTRSPLSLSSSLEFAPIPSQTSHYTLYQSYRVL